jgi:hypothetical protein
MVHLFLGKLLVDNRVNVILSGYTGLSVLIANHLCFIV